MEVCEFAKWLQGAGINVVVGIILPGLLEIWPWFKNQVGMVKSLLTMLIFLIIPMVGVVFGGLAGCHGWSFVDVFWPALVSGFLAYWASQGSFNFIVKPLARKNA